MSIVSAVVSIKALIKDVEILPNIFSDHSAITLSMSSVVTETKSGPGFWKFNNSLLTDENYLQMITTQIPEFVSKYQELTDKALLWELIKMEIKPSTTIFAKRKGKQSRSEEKGDICWRIEFLCFFPVLLSYFGLLSLRNILLLCNRSEHVS